jgi:hypothetical protein
VRLEYLPILFGVIVALAGIGLVADAWLPDREVRIRERRRRARAERHRGGEAAIGFAVILLGAALMGHDRWMGSRWAIAIAFVLLAVGSILNRQYIREQLDFRGPARRDPTTQVKPGMPEQTPPERMRVR